MLPSIFGENMFDDFFSDPFEQRDWLINSFKLFIVITVCH